MTMGLPLQDASAKTRRKTSLVVGAVPLLGSMWKA